MAKQEKLIIARHFEHGGTQTFPESHWRLVDKKVWTEVRERAATEPPPEVVADLEQRSQEQPVHKRGRPAKTETL